MVREVAIPVFDQTTETVTLIGWLKREGDEVRQGEAVCEIETAKATVEVPAPAPGRLRRILIQPGTEVPPRTVVAIIAEDGDEVPDLAPYDQTVRSAALAKPPEASSSTTATTPPPASRKLIISPRARRLAEQQNLDLNGLQGSGPGGRILEEDVEAALAAPAKPSGGPLAAAPSAAARAKAERVTRSWQSIPHFYTAITIELERVAAHRSANPALTYTDFMALALARTLPEHPFLNGFWRNEAAEAAAEIRLGLVVEAGQGLVIAALADLRGRSLEDIAAERARVVAQARAGRLSALALAEPTFTLSNVGPGHIDLFTAVISPPQVAILSVGSIQAQPRVAGTELVIRRAATFTLGVDHRAVDGRQAARFLEQLRTELENGP
jgi:pyruvate dehydrogenase E2 component (dihydrolipoamide acetyltransferase)